MRPWITLDRLDTPEGTLELRQRGEREFLIVVGGRVLMSSQHARSETFLAEDVCRRLADRKAPRVLVGGLGMGITLRAALDVLPQDAKVVVAELNTEVVRWCRGSLAPASADALADPRVSVHMGDVTTLIAHHAKSGPAFDAILLDLYEGPHAATQPPDDPRYGPTALGRTRKALTPNGWFAVWGEVSDDRFDRELRRAGFRFERHHPGKGGSPHCVWVAYQSVGA
ncbi:MAG: spermidine synthase [Myxococcota bacterium]